MSNVTTAKQEKAKVFQTIFSSPGMSEKCKINLVVSRQNILLLSRLIEAGLLADKNRLDDEIIAALPDGSLEDFKVIHEEILRKGDLAEFYQHLRSL